MKFSRRGEFLLKFTTAIFSHQNVSKIIWNWDLHFFMSTGSPIHVGVKLTLGDGRNVSYVGNLYFFAATFKTVNKCLFKYKVYMDWMYSYSSFRKSAKYRSSWRTCIILTCSPPSLKFLKFHRYNKKRWILDSLQNFELFYFFHYFNQILRYVIFSQMRVISEF